MSEGAQAGSWDEKNPKGRPSIYCVVYEGTNLGIRADYQVGGTLTKR